MINLQPSLMAYENDVYDITHIFEKYKNEDFDLSISEQKSQQKTEIIVELNGKKYTKILPILDVALVNKRYEKRTIKFLIYTALSEFYGVSMPWGSLTGVRPSKIVYDLLKDNYDLPSIVPILQKEYGLSEQKSKLIANVVQNQLQVKTDKLQIDLYINIPICPTRCSYCSFISSVYDRCKKYINDYIMCLVKEINAVKKMVINKGLVIKNIYMGGGTPTSLSSDELDKILSMIDFPFEEFTVECGRPDTITKEKLDVLKKNGVTRISINPQTLNDKTLELIGRKHTSQEFFEKYNLARTYDFIVNCDLICGLPNETFKDFKRTLDTIISLSPHNITVHTLAVKRASVLIEDTTNVKDDYIAEMVEYANESLTKAGYNPYYLYRQKNMLGLYENVGYYKDDTICDFNVESMEEKVSIIACGAGAISKCVFESENRIERCANVKQIQDYIARIDEMIERKKQLFS